MKDNNDVIKTINEDINTEAEVNMDANMDASAEVSVETTEPLTQAQILGAKLKCYRKARRMVYGSCRPALLIQFA